MDQIHVLGGEVSPTGLLRTTIACWVPRDPGTPTWLTPPSSSVVASVTPEELSAIRTGTIIERVATTDWTKVAFTDPDSIPQLALLAQALYLDIAQELDRERQFAIAIGGRAFSGVAWYARSGPPVPEQARGTAQNLPRRQSSGAVSSGSEAEILSSIRDHLAMLVNILSE